MPKDLINWADFSKLDIRVGTIETAKVFETAKKPAYLLTINFGEFGIKKTSAQITKRYKPQNLIGKQIVAIINFPPKQIANIMSECLILGAVDRDDVILIKPGTTVKNGLAIG